MASHHGAFAARERFGADFAVGMKRQALHGDNHSIAARLARFTAHDLPT
jgi:hypothetical protein